jgi:hypothetical protein
MVFGKNSHKRQLSFVPGTARLSTKSDAWKQLPKFATGVPFSHRGNLDQGDQVSGTHEGFSQATGEETLSQNCMRTTDKQFFSPRETAFEDTASGFFSRRHQKEGGKHEDIQSKVMKQLKKEKLIHTNKSYNLKIS